MNLNIDNLFNQDGILNYTTTPWRDQLSFRACRARPPPGVLSPRDAYLLSGYDPAGLVTSLRAAGTNVRDNSLFGKPSSYQGRRQLRFGLKYSF